MVPINQRLVSCRASRRCYCGRARLAVVHPCLSSSIVGPSCPWIYLVPFGPADASCLHCLLGQKSLEVPSYLWYKEVFSFACFQLMYSFHRVPLMLAVWDQGKKSPRVWWSYTAQHVTHGPSSCAWVTSLSLTFSGLAEDVYKPDMYRRTQGVAELCLGMQRKHVMDNITASQS